MSTLPASHALEFALYGFTVLEGAITEERAAELAVVLAQADRVAGTDYTHQQAYARHVKSVFVHDPVFLELIDNPTVLAFVEDALGPDIILGSLNARIVRPGDPAQPLHSDIPPALRKTGRPVMLNAVWMLDAFTADNGATRIVPGSHRHPDPEPPAGVALPYVLARPVTRAASWCSTASAGTVAGRTRRGRPATRCSPTTASGRGCVSRSTRTRTSPRRRGTP